MGAQEKLGLEILTLESEWGIARAHFEIHIAIQRERLF